MERSLTSGRLKWSRWLRRGLLAIAVAGLLAYLPYRMLDPAGSRRLERLRVEVQRSHREARVLLRDNERMEREIDALKRDPLAIEDIARNDLGMVYPGELVIRVEDE